jgi:hypothetical protein
MSDKYNSAPANLTIANAGAMTDRVVQTYKDMGDGTHALVVSVDAAAAATLPTGAATDASVQAVTAAVNARVPAAVIPGLLPVDVLGMPGDPVPDLAITTATATLAAAGFGSARRVSIVATSAMRFTLTSGAPTTPPMATAGNLLLAGERLDIDVPATNPTLTVIRASGAGITVVDGICNVMRLL